MKSKITKTKKKTVAKVTEPAFTCRTCGGNECDLLAVLPVQRYAGVTDDGRSYTSIHRQRVRCVTCQQVGFTKTYAGGKE